MVAAQLPQAQPAGRTRLKVWGFEVYDAQLWVAPGFRQSAFAASPLALELAYLRAFTAADIARRSLDEMRRAGDFSREQGQQWQQALKAALPDVAPGDRILGIHRPGRGVAFVVNGKPAGEIADPYFAALFFAIWLGPNTSEPAMRQALLAGTPP